MSLSFDPDLTREYYFFWGVRLARALLEQPDEKDNVREDWKNLLHEAARQWRAMWVA
jgi:hypothetical protein